MVAGIETKRENLRSLFWIFRMVRRYIGKESWVNNNIAANKVAAAFSSGAVIERNENISHNETVMPKRNRNFEAKVLGPLIRIYSDTNTERAAPTRYWYSYIFVSLVASYMRILYYDYEHGIHTVFWVRIDRSRQEYRWMTGKLINRRKEEPLELVIRVLSILERLIYERQ